MPRRASTSDSVPSSDPRRRRSGQLPSWTCATQTSSHSRPLRGVRGQHRHGVGIGTAPGERVARDLLRAQMLGELLDAGLRQPVGEVRGRLDESDDGVEIAIGRRAADAAPGAGQLPPARRGPRPATPPTARPRRSHPPRGRRARRPAPRRPARPAGGRARAAARRRRRRRARGRGRRPRPGAAAAARAAAAAGTPSHRPRAVRPAAARRGPRRARRAARRRRARRAACGRRAARPAGRSSPRTATGHARRDHGPAQRAQRLRRRAHEHRHLRPRHAVEVRRAHAAGEVGGLLARGAEDADMQRPRFGAVDRPQVAVLGASRQPRRHAAARLEQRRPGPAARAQRDDGHGLAATEADVDVADRRVVRPAEGVDRLVRVADEDEFVGTVGQQREQFGLRRVGVLILVDEDPSPPFPLTGQQLRVVAQRVDRALDELGGVETAGIAQHGDALVLLQEPPGGHPVRRARARVPSSTSPGRPARARPRA